MAPLGKTWGKVKRLFSGKKKESEEKGKGAKKPGDDLSAAVKQAQAAKKKEAGGAKEEPKVWRPKPGGQQRKSTEDGERPLQHRSTAEMIREDQEKEKAEKAQQATTSQEPELEQQAEEAPAKEEETALQPQKSAGAAAAASSPSHTEAQEATQAAGTQEASKPRSSKAGVTPPAQPVDSEKNTQEDDARSDSDLSSVGEFEKYGPSEEEEEPVLDENGNPIDKANMLPKGIDLTGVEGGKFVPAKGTQPTPIKNEGMAQAKEIPSVTATMGEPGAETAENNDVFNEKTNEEEEQEKQQEGSIKSSHTSSSVVSSPQAQAEASKEASTDLKREDSTAAEAGTPARVTAPRYASLVPPKTPKDASLVPPKTPKTQPPATADSTEGPVTAAGKTDETLAANAAAEMTEESVTAAAGKTDEMGAVGKKKKAAEVEIAETSADKTAETVAPAAEKPSMLTADMLEQHDKGQEEQQQAAEAPTPSKPCYASLVPPRKKAAPTEPPNTPPPQEAPQEANQESAEAAAVPEEAQQQQQPQESEEQPLSQPEEPTTNAAQQEEQQAGGEESGEPSPTSAHSSFAGMDQASRLQARKAEKEAAARAARPKAEPISNLPRFMQPTVAYEAQLAAKESVPEKEDSSPVKGRPFSATAATRGGTFDNPTSLAMSEREERVKHRAEPISNLPRFMQPTVASEALRAKQAEQAAAEQQVRSPPAQERAKPTTSLDSSNLPRFMQPTISTQSLMGNTKEAEARFQATQERSISAEQRAQSKERRRTGGEESSNSLHSDAHSGSKARPASSHLPRYMQPTAAAQGHTIYGYEQGAEKPTFSSFDVSSAMQPDEADGSAHVSSSKSRLPKGPVAPPTKSTVAASKQRSTGPAPPTCPASARPAKAEVPQQSRIMGSSKVKELGVKAGARPESAPATGRRAQGDHTANGATQPQVKAAPPPAKSGLPFGEWSLVRLKKPMICDAVQGTASQETVDGGEEVFQCDQVLQPKALAVVIAHEVQKTDGAVGQKTWVFCPDPLCMNSVPEGSNLPPWPQKLQLRGDTKISRAEFDNLKALGLDVGGAKANASLEA